MALLLYDNPVSGNCYKVRLLFGLLGIEYEKREAEDTPYLPDDPYERAQVLQWMFFEQYKHEPAIAVLRYWLSIRKEELPAAVAEEKRDSGRVALRVMERHLREREYFVGGRFTIADICLYAYTHIADEGGFDLEPLPAVREWLARVADRPGFVPIST